MKTQPIVAAEVDLSDPAAPVSLRFGDTYHARAGALGQARHVFLGGNGLPQRWRGRRDFVILETGFGLGHNFLTTWDAWRQDPQRSEHLSFISLEKHPLGLADLQRAHAASALPDLAGQLTAAWPPLTPNLHRLAFEGGRVELLLGLGPALTLARELVAEVDAFYLDGFAPASNPELWDRYLFKALARLAAAGATAATWSVARSMREALAATGFEVERAPGFADKPEMSIARFTPRHATERPAGRVALAPQAREAVVLGAGLAGAACALALSERGVACTVIDALSGPAQASSGNPGGLFHGTVNPDDGAHARFNRAAALATQAQLEQLALPWRQRGLLRLETRRNPAQMAAELARLGLPANFAQALSAAEAAALAGTALPGPAWFYPGGGALDPAAYARALLARSGARLVLNQAVADLRSDASGWTLLDGAGREIAHTPLLLLAGGHAQLPLLRALDPALAARLTVQRGQLSQLSPAPWRPGVPVAGDGYVLADTGQGVWCGATTQDDDLDPALRAADHADNLARYARLRGAPVDAGEPAGRVGWRLIAPDRLPLIGGLAAPHQGRADQLRLLPRRPGLVLCTALASRGIGWAALAGQTAAALALGGPRPLEADLLDAVDPLRLALREALKA